jgi:large subunit ribosomal protein L25
MARKELSVEPRQVTGKKVAQLRRTGVLPANLYGHGLDSVTLQVVAADFDHTLREITANEVIDLKVGGERAARPVVIHHVQRNPLTGGILHADFYQVSLREKMRADVPLVLTGSSDAVATYNGVLLQALELLHIEALPLDIPATLEVDISVLAELDSALHVRDVPVPASVTVLSDPDVVVVRVASPRVAVEGEEPAEAAPAAAEQSAAATTSAETANEGGPA